MIVRTLAGFGAALALVGLVHAQEPQVTVSLQGKSHAQVRADLYHAAQKVCSEGGSPFDMRDVTCVDETYAYSLGQLHRAHARLQRTALETQPAPASLR